MELNAFTRDFELTQRRAVKERMQVKLARPEALTPSSGLHALLPHFESLAARIRQEVEQSKTSR